MDDVDRGAVMVGLIADTHGRIRPDALVALAGTDLILHAGDVGGTHVLDALRQVAPVRAVRGNTDVLDDPLLEPRLELGLGRWRLVVVHGHELGSPTPARLVERYRADVIVFGHTHRPLVERIGPTLVVNPGSAGPARFRLPVSVARLDLGGARPEARIVELDR